MKCLFFQKTSIIYRKRGVFMKKRAFLLTFLLILSCFFVFSCENATEIRTATISEITASGSKNYGVRVSFMNDSRLREKYVDVQVKFNKIGQIIFWEEHNERLTFEIDEIDEWYSLTSLIVNAKEQNGTEDFEKHNEALARTYLFNYDGSINVDIRVVAGEKEENGAGTGYILVGSELISDKFTLKIQ